MMSDIIVNTKVKIRSDDSFNGLEGIVLDLESKLNPGEGPIAVFFGSGNLETPFDHSERDWKMKVLTKDNYMEEGALRTRCFFIEELQKIEEWSIGYRARELYGDHNFHHLYQLTFALVPNTHLCHLEKCATGLMATEKTLFNAEGSVVEYYTCEECHKKHHGMCGDGGPKLKDPLPGAPVKMVA